jgi:hypothetical protein
MPLLTEDELKAFPEPTTAEVLPKHVARYWDLMALADRQPAKVIGAGGRLKDRPGFEVELLGRGSQPDATYRLDRHEILMPMRAIGGSPGRAAARCSTPATPPPSRRASSIGWRRR